MSSPAVETPATSSPRRKSVTVVDPKRLTLDGSQKNPSESDASRESPIHAETLRSEEARLTTGQRRRSSTGAGVPEIAMQEPTVIFDSNSGSPEAFGSGVQLAQSHGTTASLSPDESPIGGRNFSRDRRVSLTVQDTDARPIAEVDVNERIARMPPVPSEASATALAELRNDLVLFLQESKFNLTSKHFDPSTNSSGFAVDSEGDNDTARPPINVTRGEFLKHVHQICLGGSRSNQPSRSVSPCQPRRAQSPAAVLSPLQPAVQRSTSQDSGIGQTLSPLSNSMNVRHSGSGDASSPKNHTQLPQNAVQSKDVAMTLSMMLWRVLEVSHQVPPPAQAIPVAKASKLSRAATRDNLASRAASLRMGHQMSIRFTQDVPQGIDLDYQPSGGDFSRADSAGSVQFRNHLASVTSHAQLGRDFDGYRTINQYVALQDLGKGAQGKVYLAQDTDRNELRAIKVVRRPAKSKVQQYRAVQREIAIMKKCRHRNVVALHEVIDDNAKQSLYLVMQYVEHGSLVQMRPDGTSSRTIPSDTLVGYARQLCAGLKYLHNHNVVHRDIKPENILLGANDTVYLSDFGVSEVQDNGENISKIRETFGGGTFICEGPISTAVERGTRAFFAPELVDTTTSYTGAKIDGKAVDVWAFGLSLYVMLVGKLPWSLEEGSQKYYEQLVNVPIEYPEEISPEWKEILSGMLDKNPAKRWPVSKIRSKIKKYYSSMFGEWDYEDGTDPFALQAEASTFGAPAVTRDGSHGIDDDAPPTKSKEDRPGLSLATTNEDLSSSLPSGFAQSQTMKGEPQPADPLEASKSVVGLTNLPAPPPGSGPYRRPSRAFNGTLATPVAAALQQQQQKPSSPLTENVASPLSGDGGSRLHSRELGESESTAHPPASVLLTDAGSSNDGSKALLAKHLSEVSSSGINSPKSLVTSTGGEAGSGVCSPPRSVKQRGLAIKPVCGSLHESSMPQLVSPLLRTNPVPLPPPEETERNRKLSETTSPPSLGHSRVQSTVHSTAQTASPRDSPPDDGVSKHQQKRRLTQAEVEGAFTTLKPKEATITDFLSAQGFSNAHCDTPDISDDDGGNSPTTGTGTEGQEEGTPVVPNEGKHSDDRAASLTPPPVPKEPPNAPSGRNPRNSTPQKPSEPAFKPRGNLDNGSDDDDEEPHRPLISDAEMARRQKALARLRAEVAGDPITMCSSPDEDSSSDDDWR